MKKNYFLTLLFFVVLFAINLPAQTGVEKKIIATLGPGETLANSENCFLLNKNPEYISFVTVAGSGSDKQYFCYGKDGKRTGPVKQPDAAYWAECADNVVDNCVSDDQPDLTGMEKYLDPNDGSILFKGKKFGPYGQIILFNMSPDEQYIYAIALSAEMKMLYFDNTGRKVDITGMPEQIIISPDGKTSYVKVKGSLNPFDPEALQKMINDPEETNNPKVFLFGIDGNKYGPYPSSSFNDTWFTPSGQWVIYANSEIYLNGKLLFKVDEYVSRCDIWISTTGTNYAWANYEKIMFRDGSSFIAPLTIEYIVENSKGYLKWISLEDEKNLVFYRRPF